MKPKLATIVIPSRNVEDYIGECLDTLLSQTYGDIEIVVIDDGSTDGTPEVIESFASVDDRIRFFRNENHGVSFSRNYGIDRGEGDYLLFVDADDVVAPDFVEALVKPLACHSCELSATGIDSFSKGAPKFSLGEKHFYAGNEMHLACFRSCKGFLCNKGFLYSTVRSQGIRLDESVAQSEDMLFLLDYLDYCKMLAFDDGVRYGYRQRRDSAANDFSNSRWFDAVRVYEAYERKLGGNFELAKEIRKAFLPISYEAQWRYRHSRLEDPELLARIEAMRLSCEKNLSKNIAKYRLKMFVYRHFMGIEMRRRRMVAR